MGMEFLRTESFMPTFKSAMLLKNSSRRSTGTKSIDMQNAEELSPEEQKKLELQQKREQEAREKQAKQNELDMLNDQLESSKEQAENTKKGFETLAKCLTIASRISRGDIVPMKDMKYLAENEPDLYKQAILLRQPKKDPKEYDSVLDDEEDETNETNKTGTENSTESADSSLGSESVEVSSSEPSVSVGTE